MDCCEALKTTAPVRTQRARRDYARLGTPRGGWQLTVSLTFALILAITGEELMGYQLLSFSSLEVPSYLVLCLVQLVAAGMIFALSGRVGSFLRQPVSFVFAGVVALCGAGFLWFGLAAASMVLELTGFTFLSIGALFLKIVLLELLSSVPLLWTKGIVFAAVSIQSFFAPLFVLSGSGAWTLSAVMLFAGTGIAWRARNAQVRAAETASPGFRKQLTLSPAVVIGFAIVCLSVSFLNPLGLYDSISAEYFVAFTFATHILAALLFGLFTFLLKDSSHSFAFKGIDSLVLLAFVLSALLGSFAFFPRALCTMLFSLFEFVTFLAIADLASYSSAKPLKIFAGYYFIVRSFSSLGLLMNTSDEQLLLADGSFSLLGVALASAAIVAAVWLMTETHLNDFFWGNTLQVLGESGNASSRDAGTEEPAFEVDDLKSSVERRVQALSDEYDLSPRERDVLDLIAMGRSSTYVAEELFLSANTVRKHIAHIYAKCDVHSKQELLTKVQTVMEKTSHTIS